MTITHWRRCRTGLILLALAGPAARPLVAQSVPATVRVDTAAVLASARKEIDAANAAWFPSLQRRDAAAIAEAYADSGLFIAADGTVVRGRAAVADMYAARMRTQRRILAGAVVQEGLVATSPILILEWGRGWLEMESSSEGGPPVRSTAKYLTVWQRANDGHWRIVRNLTF